MRAMRATRASSPESAKAVVTITSAFWACSAPRPGTGPDSRQDSEASSRLINAAPPDPWSPTTPASTATLTTKPAATAPPMRTRLGPAELTGTHCGEVGPDEWLHSVCRRGPHLDHAP